MYFDVFVFSSTLALMGLQPLQKSGFGVADRLAELDVRRPVAAHARLGQPGQADLEKLGGFLWRQQHDGWRGRLLGDRAGGRCGAGWTVLEVGHWSTSYSEVDRTNLPMLACANWSRSSTV